MVSRHFVNFEPTREAAPTVLRIAVLSNRTIRATEQQHTAVIWSRLVILGGEERYVLDIVQPMLERRTRTQVNTICDAPGQSSQPGSPELQAPKHVRGQIPRLKTPQCTALQLQPLA